MNATGHVQKSDARRRYVNFARNPLRSYFHEPRKIEIHLLYQHFVLHRLFIICEILILIVQISGEEKL